MGKEMMLICVKRALQASESIRITAPPEVTRLRKDVENLRQGAKDAKPATPAVKEDDGQKSGMLDSAKELAGEATETAAAEVVAGDANEFQLWAASIQLNGSLNGMADQLEKVINTIEKPFATVGQEIIEAKKDKIQAVFEYCIADLLLVPSGVAVNLVRGDEPHGSDEYAKVTDALADYICRKAEKNFEAQLGPILEEAIKEHTITKTWNSGVENYNSLCAQIGAIDHAKNNNLTPQPMEPGINVYIKTQCIEQITKMIGEKETQIRKSPSTAQSKTPRTFTTVFSGSMVTEDVFKRFDSGEDTATP